MAYLVALLPCLVFLIALWLMDSFKLVRRTSIAIALAYGAMAALSCEALHGWLLAITGMDMRIFSRYIAPITEEVAKAAFIVVLVGRGRIGFLVDAAVLAFAVGTGFALVENVTYLRDLGDAPLMLWALRGLGTGVLHGTTPAIAAILGKDVADRLSEAGGLRHAGAMTAGIAAAIVIHSAYNHLLIWPVTAAVVVLVALPLVLVSVFERSERVTREWVGTGLDLDLELLQLVTSKHVHDIRVGRYLRELRARFDGAVVADMFCLLRIDLELAIQAKARLVAREAGVEVPVDPDLHHALAERDYLRRSVGATGLLALEPLRVTSYRDDWHRYLLAQSGARARVHGWFERLRPARTRARASRRRAT